ncbi:SRPBCC domain-containing protein [Bacteroidota bacterium]
MRKSISLNFIIFVLFISSNIYGQVKYDVFSFKKEVTLPGTPEVIYDAITGDISGWWDHSFKEKPIKLYIEAKPGGGFWEIFDEEGNGALHATVIYAERGKMLRFEGPLGLSGKAIQLVCTYNFEPVGQDSTKLKLEVHGSGEMDENIPGIVENVWEHFIFERFEPYIDEGKHLK